MYVHIRVWAHNTHRMYVRSRLVTVICLFFNFSKKKSRIWKRKQHYNKNKLNCVCVCPRTGSYRSYFLSLAFPNSSFVLKKCSYHTMHNTRTRTHAQTVAHYLSHVFSFFSQSFHFFITFVPTFVIFFIYVHVCACVRVRVVMIFFVLKTFHFHLKFAINIS